MRTCECCGTILALDDRFTPMQQRIVEIVAAAKGRWLSSEEICDQLYSDRWDGGPENAVKVLHSQISKMRRVAGQQIIESRKGSGAGGYRLYTNP